ncbi:MAG: aldehyde dehydrogenase [Clostridiales bacterium]|nr:aldehyde dehydrogenase [Clostridiales bacterium]
MTEQEIQRIIQRQRTYFRSGKTLPIEQRLTLLKKLKTVIIRREKEIADALKEDLGKSQEESYMCEIGMTLSELTYMIRHTRAFARENTVWTPLAQFASRSFIKKSPYGVALIMSPWNYPFLLSMEPLTDAIAAGNTVILKPSAYSPSTSQIMAEIVEECFLPEQAAVITGGREENQVLLEQKFDTIFFTGSQAVGKEVMRRAAEHLTPVTLELGGKSPCIVDETANLKLAAKRIVFGKYLNCGQTCVAPDYIVCQESVRDALMEELKKQTIRQFGPDPLSNPKYGKIINEKHFQRILCLMDQRKIILGGKADAAALRIAPTIMSDISWDDPVMQEEIFGPILPILTYHSTEEMISVINDRPTPLALYLFSSSKQRIRRVLDECSFGGGCVNDTIIHLATSSMGFGGMGESGMGSYHGKAGFDTFTHKKSIVDKKTWLDLPMRYQPYRKINDRLVRIFMR